MNMEAISLSSKSKLATRLVVWGNRVDGVRESAVDIRGCRDVTVAGNEFSSAAPPAAGAWVTALDSQDIRCEGNRHPAGAPEFKATDGKR